MFAKWLRNPFRIGTVTPSGRALSRRMAAHASLELPGAVVELGGGTGVITEALLARGVAPERLISVEYDPELAALLRHRFPAIAVVEGDAAELRQMLARLGHAQAATVVSGLPLLGMSGAVQERILGAIFDVLVPGGRMVQFTYGPAMPARARIVEQMKLRAACVGYVLLNVPPARVWCFEKA